MDATLVAFCLLALALTIAPGADMALVAKNVVLHGRRASFQTTMGIACGCSVHAVASALGLSAILAESATAFEIIKSIGALYLIWVGLRTIRGALRASSNGASPHAGPMEGNHVVDAAKHRSSSRCFCEGLLTNVLNPKVALFYLLVLPQFISGGQNVLGRSLLLAGIHVAFGIIWLCTYAALLNRLRGVLLRPRVRAWFEGVTGGVLILLGGRLALERSR